MPSRRKLRYGASSKASFKKYFAKAQKRGRPKKKKKRGRPKKKTKSKQQTIDLTATSPPADIIARSVKALKTRLEGELLRETFTHHRCRRTNWDTPANAARRKRYADSWTSESDLYRQGESFQHFCDRLAIDRNVLRRYIALKYSAPATAAVARPTRGRGRPSLLSESVMRHICEGLILLFLSVRNIFNLLFVHVL